MDDTHPTTPLRTTPSRGRQRVSPYPARDRTPTAREVRVPSPSVRTPPTAQADAEAPAPVSPAPANDAAPAPGPIETRHLQLVVRPIIKSTLGQRDASGDTLPDFAVNGNSFAEIIDRIWVAFSPRMRGRAVRTEGVWSVEPIAFEDWARMIQFKHRRHVQDNMRTERAWSNWLTAVRGETVTMLVYEYGVAIARAADLDAFMTAVIRPLDTDRAGATAERSLRDIVGSLQTRWADTFQGDAAVWRMWANYVTRNLDRSTWDARVALPPPPYVAALLRAADGPLEQHLAHLQQSARLAMDVVQAGQADYRQLHQDWEAFGRRIQAHQQHLQTREAILTAFIRDLRLPRPSEGVDPFARVENIEDHEHAE